MLYARKQSDSDSCFLQRVNAVIFSIKGVSQNSFSDTPFIDES